MKKLVKISLIFLGIFFVAFAVAVLAQDENSPAVSVVAEPAQVTTEWQNSEAFAYVFCEDEEIDCDNTTYKLKIYDSDPVACSDDYEEYSFCNGASCAEENPQEISSHNWVCGAAKDLVGNVGFSEPVEFKVDINPPEGKISISPEAVRIDEEFDITVEGEDNVGISLVCYRKGIEEDDKWECHNCPDTPPFCSYTFKHSETALGKYKYSGQVQDVAETVSFTEPEYVTGAVQTDPLVSTISVDLQGEQADLSGYLNYLGGAEAVEVWFEWGETTDYGYESDRISKSDTGSFDITISGLDPKEVYHFRAAVKNGVGGAYGVDMVTTELIKNGGFETGSLNSWTEFGAPFGLRKASTEDVYKGLYSGLIGFKEGTNRRNGKSGIYQDVSIPQAAASIELSFFYIFYTEDWCTYDWINIYLKDKTGKTLKTYVEYCRPRRRPSPYGWHQIKDNDLSAYAGKTVRIHFEVENRYDKSHRSWAYIDGVSLAYVPTYLPSAETKEATAIDGSSAVLNGELLNMGNADSVNVWFEWGKTTDYGHKTYVVTLDSPQSFAVGIGNLSSETTYHFRAVAENSAGKREGKDMSFETLHAAAGGWISPTGHRDPDNMWGDELKAYDNDLHTYTTNNGSGAAGYRGWLYLTLPEPVRSDKIRINADYWSTHVDMDIDVLLDGSWTTLLSRGAVKDCEWTEFEYPEGMVTEARVRYYYKVSSWHFWVYEFQFYKVPDEPITLPAGNTLEATSIEENSAILHGQVIDDGRELTEVRFQYGKTPAYGINTPWMKGPGGIGWASGETFGKLISGLEEGVTYHFRAQIKNSAGITSGADKTFFTQPAPVGWVPPQGFSDPTGKWENEDYAFDDEIATYARSQRAYGDGRWSEYLYLTREEIFSDKIRFWARELVEVDLVKIDVYRDDSWVNVYNGTFPDYQWMEASFSGGKVSQARIQFHSRYSDHYFYYHLYEFEFWKLEEPPEVETRDAFGISTKEAVLGGELIDMGGAESVKVWFQYSTSSDLSGYQETEPFDQSLIGLFSQSVTDLFPATKYYFRAAAENEAGIVYAEISDFESFETSGECTPGEEDVCETEQGCEAEIECTEDGEWPACPRDYFDCPKGELSCLDCPCPEPEEGYQSPEYGDCTEQCWCDIGTGPGEPCEPWLANQPPTAINLSIDDFEDTVCGITSGARVRLKWEFSDLDSGDEQFAYRLEIAADFGFSSIVVRSCDPNLTDPDARCMGPSEEFANDPPSYSLLPWDQTYYWRLKVWDSDNLESSWIYPPSPPGSPSPAPGEPFTTPLHSYPYPDFDWIPPRPSIDEVAKFCSVYEEITIPCDEPPCPIEVICPEDKSICYDDNNDPVSCSEGLFVWTMPEVEGTDYQFVDGTGSNSENPKVKFLTTAGGNVKLEITKDGYGPCDETYPIGVTYPLPLWKEIAPF